MTEIFDQNPQSRNDLKLNKGYFKYYIESNSHIITMKRTLFTKIELAIIIFHK